VTKARTLAEALRQLLPRCIQGYSWGEHILVKAMVEELIIEDVAFIDLSGLKVRLDYAIEMLAKSWEANPVLGFFASLLLFLKVMDGSFRMLAQPVNIKVNHPGYFLVDTGATTTVINTAILPPEARRVALLAGKSAEAQTVTERVKLSKGVARISLAGVTVDERVLIVDAPSSPYHLMGMNTLRRILGSKVLLDFENARVCKVLEAK
jgi:predicted aspartyl protease